MSSSAVSITANPPRPSLRRSTLTAEKKSAVDDGIQTEEETTRRRNDIIHTIKPLKETAVAKPTDGVQIKTFLPTNSTAKLRKRTVVKRGSGSASPRRPWKTVVSVIVRNLSLVVILLILVQMIRRLVVNQKYNQKYRQNDASSGVDVMFSYHFERRIDEMERLLKSTGKMMQVQVEGVDRKIEDEIVRLRSVLNRRIDGRHGEVFNRLSEFDGRIESMEKLLSSTEWLSKDEFGKFMEDFKGKRKGGDTGEVKLDEIRSFAREIVDEEITKHAADGLGRVDYAVASGGGKVLKHSEVFNGGRGFGRWFTGKKRSDAVKMLQPSFGQTGECFPLKGDSGFVEIKLRTAIVPEAITLEHVSKSVAFDRSSAPKDCKVWGWSGNEDAQKEHLLTEFTYDLQKSSAQTFNVLLDTKDVSPTVVDTVRLQFMSNHGSATHTCIYRVRVHGHQPHVS